MPAVVLHTDFNQCIP